MAIAKATWAWVRGKCEEAMREVLGAGRGVQAGEVETPAMAAEARRDTRRGAEGDEEGDGGDGVPDSERVILSRKALSFVPRSFNKVFLSFSLVSLSSAVGCHAVCILSLPFEAREAVGADCWAGHPQQLG